MTNQSSESIPSPYSSLRSVAELTLASTKRRIASTSFIYPASVGENAEKLTGIMPEMGICMFESRACLEYTESDLPVEMADFPMDYHVHLPVDLDWENAPEKASADMLRLVEKCAFFSPLCWILHPPADPGHLHTIRRELERAEIAPSSVLLENIKGHDLSEIWDSVRENGFSVCLDIGHILAYGQEKTLDLPGIREHTRMVHAYAPKDGGRHTALDNLDENGLALFNEILDTMHDNCTLTLEVFSEPDLIRSLIFLHEIFTGGRQ